QPGGATPQRHAGGEPARGGPGAGAFSTHHRLARRTNPVRQTGRGATTRRADGTLCQRATGTAPRGTGRIPGAEPPSMLTSSPAQRDPAAFPRLLVLVLALALLWPGLKLSELDIGVLFDGSNAETMGVFLSGFWPPEHGSEFLALLLQATQIGRASW